VLLHPSGCWHYKPQPQPWLSGGRLSTHLSTFSARTSAGVSDHHLIFPGPSAATTSTSDASPLPGRSYVLPNCKFNASAASQLLHILTPPLDGLRSWQLSHTNPNIDPWYVMAVTGTALLNLFPAAGLAAPGYLAGPNVRSLPHFWHTPRPSSVPFSSPPPPTDTMRLDPPTVTLGLGPSSFHWFQLPDRFFVRCRPVHPAIFPPSRSAQGTSQSFCPN